MNKSKQAIKSTLIIIIFTLGSKLLGFIREVLIASKFGSGMETDAFFISLTATSLLTGLISNAISTTFIPILSEIESKESHRSKLEHTNNIINVVFVISIIVVMIGWLSTPFIVSLLAKGFQGEQFNLAVKMTRIGLPMILFSGIIGVFTGYLQSEQRFISSAAIGIPFNIVYIIFLLFLSSKFGIEGLMVTAVLAVVSQFLIQIPETIISGYRYKFKFDIRDKYITKTLMLSIPVFIGVAINDLNAIIDRTIASTLVPGSISVLNYANRLNILVLTVFISAITTVIFPILSKEVYNNDIIGVKRTMKYGINLILLITIPASVGMILLAKPIVGIAFQRGEFDSTATIMTAQALIFYTAGLIFMALRLFIIRVYYSLQDTKTPMINGAISVGLNIVLNLILVQFMGHAGLALATSVATTIATLLMFYNLKKKIGPLGTLTYIKCGLKAGLASAIMGIVVYIVYHELYSVLGVSKLYNLISLLSAVVIGVIVYGILCYLLGVEEARDIIDKLRIRFTKGYA